MALTVVSADALPLPITVVVPKDGVFKDLYQAVSTTCLLKDDKMLLFAEIYITKVVQLIENPSLRLDLIRDDDLLVAYILPKDNDTSPLVVFFNEKVNRYSQCVDGFGIPLMGRASDLSRGSDIHNLFLKLLNPFQLLAENSTAECNEVNASGGIEIKDVIPPIEHNLTGDIKLTNEEHSGPAFQYYWSEELELASRGIELQMDKELPSSVLSKTINVIVSWPDAMIELYDTFTLVHISPISNEGILTQPPTQKSIPLYKCLEAFLMEEPLGLNDTWYCPNCKKHQEISKKLDLWRLPSILIIHLKRFHFTKDCNEKLETFVDFPIHNLDLSPFNVHKNGDGSNCYELYAISNHYGSLSAGHYTAYVKHLSGGWYDFNDTRVSVISEDQTKTKNAYVLFYRRV